MTSAETSRHFPSIATTYRKLRNSTACHTYQRAFRETTGSAVTLEPAGWTRNSIQSDRPLLAAPIRFGGEMVGHFVSRSLGDEADRVPAQRLLTAYADRVGGLINYVLLELEDNAPAAVALAVSLAQFRGNRDVSLSEVAERACMPTQNFAALFQQATELSFENYLIRSLLEKPRRSLFIAEASSVQAAADSIGVPKHELKALFVDYLGESPKAYRHRMQKNHRALLYWPEGPPALDSKRSASKPATGSRRRTKQAKLRTPAAQPRTVRLSSL
ncbi:MAG: AraC-like DNA-binding protein [Verrucomicrobiales bacterium]|jgi:AraC-like DNA-binding protein